MLVAQAGLAKPEKEESVMMINAQTDLNFKHVWEAILLQSLMPYTKYEHQGSREYWGMFWW